MCPRLSIPSFLPRPETVTITKDFGCHTRVSAHTRRLTPAGSPGGQKTGLVVCHPIRFSGGGS